MSGFFFSMFHNLDWAKNRLNPTLLEAKNHKVIKLREKWLYVFHNLVFNNSNKATKWDGEVKVRKISSFYFKKILFKKKYFITIINLFAGRYVGILFFCFLETKLSTKFFSWWMYNAEFSSHEGLLMSVCLNLIKCCISKNLKLNSKHECSQMNLKFLKCMKFVNIKVESFKEND